MMYSARELLVVDLVRLDDLRVAFDELGLLLIEFALDRMQLVQQGMVGDLQLAHVHLLILHRLRELLTHLVQTTIAIDNRQFQFCLERGQLGLIPFPLIIALPLQGLDLNVEGCDFAHTSTLHEIVEAYLHSLQLPREFVSLALQLVLQMQLLLVFGALRLLLELFTQLLDKVFMLLSLALHLGFRVGHFGRQLLDILLPALQRLLEAQLGGPKIISFRSYLFTLRLD
jgi:hypothetical protein